jgi:hypothetical protein
MFAEGRWSKRVSLLAWNFHDSHSSIIFYLFNKNTERTQKTSLASCQSKGLSFIPSSLHSYPIIFPNTSHSICKTCEDFIIHLWDKVYTHMKFLSHTIWKCRTKVFSSFSARRKAMTKCLEEGENLLWVRSKFISSVSRAKCRRLFFLISPLYIVVLLLDSLLDDKLEHSTCTANAIKLSSLFQR